MILFIENQRGSPFEVEVHILSIVLDIKKKIVETQRIPIHKQTLFFQGKLLEDHLYADQYSLQHESRLQLFISPDHIPNLSNEQGRQPQQSPLPSIDESHVKVPQIENPPPLWSHEEFLNFQDSPLKVPQTENLPLWSHEEFLNFQDSTVKVPQKENTPLLSDEEFLNFQEPYMKFGRSDNSQVLQTEQYQVLSNSIESNLYGEDVPFTAEQFNNIQSWAATTEEIINQDSQMTVGSNNNPALQTNQSPQSDSFREIIDIPDSPLNKRRKPNPMKLRVQVLSTRANWKISVEVNENDNVGELRKNLVEMHKRSQLNLPQGGFFFIHKERQRELDDHQSFQWNGVADGDTIGVFRIIVTYPNMGFGIQGIQSHPSTQSNSIKETNNIQDWPVNKQSKPNPRKLRGLVLSFRAKWKIDAEVNENDKVGVLRRELVEMQKRYQLNLPEEGYFFIQRQRVLNDHQSFQWNGVAHGDTIEIVPRPVIYPNMGFGRQGIQSHPSPQVNSIKELINIPYSHVKEWSKPSSRMLRVLVLPFSREGRGGQKIPVVVNENDNIDVLKKELVEMQKRFHFNLPEEYFFISNKWGILKEFMSFQWNRIAHGDTIEILPGTVKRPALTNRE